MDYPMALGSEEDQDCEKKADQRPGTRPLDEHLCVPLIPCDFPKYKPSSNRGSQRDSEKDRDTFGNDAISYLAGIVVAANDFDEKYSEWCIEDYLKNRIYGDENSTIFIVTASQASPDQDLYRKSVNSAFPWSTKGD